MPCPPALARSIAVEASASLPCQALEHQHRVGREVATSQRCGAVRLCDQRSGAIKVAHPNEGDAQLGQVERQLSERARVSDELDLARGDRMKAFIVPNGGTGPSGDAAPSKDVLEDRKLVGFYLREGQLQAAVGLGRGGDPELDQDSEMAACARLVGQQIRPIPSQLSDDAVDLWSLVA